MSLFDFGQEENRKNKALAEITGSSEEQIKESELLERQIKEKKRKANVEEFKSNKALSDNKKLLSEIENKLNDSNISESDKLKLRLKAQSLKNDDNLYSQVKSAKEQTEMSLNQKIKNVKAKNPITLVKKVAKSSEELAKNTAYSAGKYYGIINGLFHLFGSRIRNWLDKNKLPDELPEGTGFLKRMGHRLGQGLWKLGDMLYQVFEGISNPSMFSRSGSGSTTTKTQAKSVSSDISDSTSENKKSESEEQSTTIRNFNLPNGFMNTDTVNLLKQIQGMHTSLKSEFKDSNIKDIIGKIQNFDRKNFNTNNIDSDSRLEALIKKGFFKINDNGNLEISEGLSNVLNGDLLTGDESSRLKNWLAHQLDLDRAEKLVHDEADKYISKHEEDLETKNGTLDNIKSTDKNKGILGKLEYLDQISEKELGKELGEEDQLKLLGSIKGMSSGTGEKAHTTLKKGASYNVISPNIYNQLTINEGDTNTVQVEIPSSLNAIEVEEEKPISPEPVEAKIETKEEPISDNQYSYIEESNSHRNEKTIIDEYINTPKTNQVSRTPVISKELKFNLQTSTEKTYNSKINLHKRFIEDKSTSASDWMTKYDYTLH